MRLPAFFSGLLSKDASVAAQVLGTISLFEPWFKRSGLPFFPEYTDHAIDHIESVIHTASSIIRDESRNLLTATDAAVLIVSSLLHDAAMHLGEDGFCALISDRVAGTGFGNEVPWSRLWEEFLMRARRFNAHELTALFGDSEPLARPATSPERWTRRDRLLIGEFIRRHHHRLAHEMALHGVPGAASDPLRIYMQGDFADLAGLVARSHGMEIRDCLPYLDSNYDLREYRGVHAIFLMALLRIADYLQVQEERAPGELLKVLRIKSPLSQREWALHGAVRDIRMTHADPEAIFIDAQPADVVVYLRLKKLLADLQRELDLSWAVLGEIYGRWKELSSLGITLRRVRSNLDREEEFARTVDYIPRHATFEAASGELIPLLIDPLYGENPEIGIRELVQNAVDAVRERKEYTSGSEEGEVTVTVEELPDESVVLTVEDQGIGMTADTVCQYFLKAGASFRRSDAWRSSFEGPSGESKVLRSGRFGIGVLAAFLLGDEIEVSTRHIDSAPDDGVFFKASLESESIELRRVSRAVGTTVRVALKDDAAHIVRRPESERDWDWYCLDSPRVRRVRNPGQVEVGQRDSLPGPGEALRGGWARIEYPGYQDVHWTYDWRFPALVCNGFVVERWHYDFALWRFKRDNQARESLWSLAMPRVSVFDPDGRLPLSLQRTGLVQDLPMRVHLVKAVTLDLLSFLLPRAPRGLSSSGEIRGWWPTLKYVGFDDRYSPFMPWFASRDGLSLINGWCLQHAGRTLWLLPLMEDRVPRWRQMKGAGDAYFAAFLSRTQASARNWVMNVLDGSAEASQFSRLLEVAGRRVLISRSIADQLERGPRHMKLPASCRKGLRREWSTDDWVVWAQGDCPPSVVDFEKVIYDASETDREWPLLGAELYRQPENEEVNCPVGEVWQKVIGRPFIPFKGRERAEVIRTALERLRDEPLSGLT